MAIDEYKKHPLTNLVYYSLPKIFFFLQNLYKWTILFLSPLRTEYEF